ncbi:MMPL family transporter [Actinomadura luteofluorescens]|uniref:MMPL family transporter n=1 Tax=Actinomadura luteofluorescens TaxID=46163 RepID=UPI002164B4D6|nr:MMPL family transporter [Actinomadura glauciflava]MCR3745555.1 putative drug exporter of the RND superfamily [Actinomadura glauciflava]
MATLLYRLGRTAFRHRLRFVVGWLVLLVLVGGGFAAFGSHLDSEATIPGSQSQRGIDLLERSLPEATGVTAQLVFAAPPGATVDDPAHRARIGNAVRQAGTAPQVAEATDPFETGTISADRRTALAQVLYPIKRDVLDDASVTALEDIAAAARANGMRAEVGGSVYSTAGMHAGIGEVIGVAVAVIVLVVTFGSLLAAGLTLVTAITGLVIGLLGLMLASNLATISDTAPSLALMVGLAVGIDYALFIGSRHRAQLADGMAAEESAARAVATAGGAVVFAGLTVIIALAGLSVVGIPFLTVMGLAAALTVLMAVAAAVTLLPALLGLAGDRLRPRPGSRAARPERAGAGGLRWARLVTRRPLLTIPAVLLVLGALALPALKLELAMPDNGTADPASTQRKAYDLISTAFGPGNNGRLLVLVHTRRGGDPVRAAAQIAEGLDLPGVISVSGPEPGTDGRTAVLNLVPAQGPRTQATQRLVRDIRARTPALGTAAGAEALVTGSTPAAIDVSDRLRDSMAPFTAVVVGLSLLLLLLVFRSLLVPVKAAAGFLLSAGAAFGSVVAVFQWGRLAEMFGVATTGPVFSFMPIVVIAVLFGLAMDYQVFLVSRIREEYVHTGRPREAVPAGSRHATRVITAAALIMFAVFAGFVTTDDLTLKPIALGLAAGILTDAFLVRMTLVPAILALTGHAAWWLPKWLNRLLPDLDIEGTNLQRPPTPHTQDSELATEPAAPSK